MLQVKIKTDNAAFGDDEDSADKGEECARILRGIADKLEQGYTCGVCMDYNGNKVGDWTL